MDDSPLIFAFDEEQNRLKVIYIEPDFPFVLDEGMLVESIESAGFYGLSIIDEGVEELLDAISKGESKKVNIADKLDGSFSVFVSKDKLYVHLSITPAFGGSKVTLDHIAREIKKLNVKSEIDWISVKKYLEEGACQDKIIARGIAPIKGKDTSFRSFVEPEFFAMEVMDEHNKPITINAHKFLEVKKGDVLMKRYPAQDGVAGLDIYGNVLPAIRGNEYYFQKDIPGAKISPDDKNMLIATKDGHPIMNFDHVIVDDFVIYDEITHATGNIDTKGSIYIKGDIDIHTSVKAEGDIICNGCIRQAKVLSGGSIVADQGISGSGVNFRSSKMRFDIKSEKDLYAAFINATAVDVQGNINIVDVASNSFLNSCGNITIGVNDGLGHLVGGYTDSLTQVDAKVIGSSATVPTKVHVGSSLAAKDEYHTTVGKVNKKEEYLDVMSQALIKMGEVESRRGSSDKANQAKDKLYKNLKSVVPELKELIGKKIDLKKKIFSNVPPHVVVREEVHGGVKLVVGHNAYNVTRSAGAGVYVVEDEKVVHKFIDDFDEENDS